MAWREFFIRRYNGLDPNILYLAEILAELRTTRTQKTVPRDRVMLKFELRPPVELDPDDMTDEEKAARIAAMKAATRARTSIPSRPRPAAKKGTNGDSGRNRKADGQADR
jgi:hypothetical protein